MGVSLPGGFGGTREVTDRHAPRAGAHTANEARERAQTMAAESASGVPLELIGLVTPLPADGGPVPGTFVLRNDPQPRTVDVAAELRAARAAIDRALAVLDNKN